MTLEARGRRAFAKKVFAYKFHIPDSPRLSDVRRFQQLNPPGSVQEICRRLGSSRREFLLALAGGKLPNEALGRWEPVRLHLHAPRRR